MRQCHLNNIHFYYYYYYKSELRFAQKIAHALNLSKLYQYLQRDLADCSIH